MTATTNVGNAKTHFSKLLQRVCNGEEMTSAETGEPGMIPSPLRDQVICRAPGNDAGKVIMTPAFDALLPEFGEPGETQSNIESLE